MRPLLIMLVCLLALTGCATPPSEEREQVQPKQTTCTRSGNQPHCTTY